MSRELDRSRLFAGSRTKENVALQIGIVLFALVTIVYLVLGQSNDDEGWYLYASRLVLQGALPYRDFAYTQMPLFPYIYSISQALGPSLFWGRVTSVFLSGGMLGMGIVIARRYAGVRASAMAALLLAAFSLGVYFDSIVKTYALVSFCFTATLFVLSSRQRADWKYPLALLFALIAALVRLTAIFFAATILLYILFAAPRRARLFALLESAAMGLVAAFFLLPNWAAASWGLLGSHLDHWGTAPLFDEARDILTTRLPDIVQNVGPILVIGAAALYFLFARRKSKAWPRDPAPLFVVSAGLLVFAASHLVNGIWQIEYLVPAITALVPIFAIGLGRLYGEAGSGTRLFIQGALIAMIFLLPLEENTQHTDLTGGRLPLPEIDGVASYVAQNSQPGDKVLALEALGVVLDANRTSLPGMTLAEFSLQNVDTATAQQMHVVNYQLVADAISQKSARVILLTDADLYTLAQLNPSNPSELPNLLSQNYTQSLVVQQFGQFSRVLYVYLSR